jgi:hypothetical protein
MGYEAKTKKKRQETTVENNMETIIWNQGWKLDTQLNIQGKI